MRAHVYIWSFLVIGLVGLNVASAQDDNQNRLESSFFRAIRANQDDSYITFGQGIGNVEPLIFEAQIAPYYLLRTRENAIMGAIISSEIIIRMANEESFPVRAPSYMPSLTIYHNLSHKNRESNNLNYLFLTLTHHSNGQEGDFFNPDGSLNTFSGDFSTNFFELGFFINKNLVPFLNTTEYFSSSVEYHVNFVRSEELDGRYSFLRWHNNFRIFRFPVSGKGLRMEKNPRVQTKLETTWLFGDIHDAGPLNIEERLNISFTMAYRPKVLTDVSLFLNVYSGEDYYNMNFSRRISVLRVGLQAYSFK